MHHISGKCKGEYTKKTKKDPPALLQADLIQRYGCVSAFVRQRVS
jgi:hypothetical protein